MVAFIPNGTSSNQPLAIPPWLWWVAAAVVAVVIVTGGVVIWQRRAVITPSVTTPVVTDNTLPVNDSTPVAPTVPTVVEPPADAGQPAPIDRRIDSDGDALPDMVENYLGTNPRQADTDGDGYPDGEEVANGYNPLGPSTFNFTL